MIQAPRALVLSPSATHPQDYGNRHRVWQVTSFLKKQGYTVDFLLYPFEAEWSEAIPAEAQAMQRAWDSFWVVPPSVPLHTRAHGDYHHIDEWWDPSLGTFLEWLLARRSYDVFVVNYAFLSKAFTYAPRSTLRVLETHDVFSGRKEMLLALGAPPEFFYTTEAEEKVAFDRSDVVVAIKDSEAKIISTMTDKEVISLPFFATRPKPAGARRTRFAGLSVGFIGAPNSVNTLNMQAFLAEFDPLVRLFCPPLRLLIAGNVGRAIRTDNPVVELMGRVENVDDFYSEIDVTVAPMAYSTGIKVKVGEAMGYGKGIVSTVNGFDGFPPTDPMHALKDLKEVSRALIELAFDKERRNELVRRSRQAAELARGSTAKAFETLAMVLHHRPRRIVIVTDRPYWREDGLASARMVQLAQFCSYLTRVIVLYLRTAKSAALRSDDPAERVEIDLSKGDVDPRSVGRQLNEKMRRIGRAEVVFSVDQPWAAALCAELVAAGHTPFVDLWCPPFAELARTTNLARQAGVAFVGGEEGRLSILRAFDTMSIRWEPTALLNWAERPQARSMVAISRSDAPLAVSAEAELAAVASARGFDLKLFSVREDQSDVEALYRAMSAPERPLAVLSIAGSGPLEQCMMTFSGIGDVPFISINRHAFPMAFSSRVGEINVVHSCGELADRIVRMHDAGSSPYVFRNAADTGWSSVWRAFEERLQRRGPLTSAAPADEEETVETLAPTQAA